MKYIIIVLSIITISLSSNISTDLRPDIELQWHRILDKDKHELFKRLKVKKEMEIRRSYFETDSTKNSIWISVNEYNKDGNQINYKAFSDSLMIETRFEEEYVTDENGNILEAYRKGKLIGTQEFDNEGRIIELINYDGDGDACWTWKYNYDEMGNEVFETQYLYDELIDTLTYYQYEFEKVADKILIKSKECLLDTSDIFYDEKEIFSYDRLGREIKYQKFRKDKSVYYHQTTNYETLSRIRIFYLHDGSIEQIDSMKINPEGKVTESFAFKNGNLIRKNFYTYNKRGFTLSELRMFDSGKRLFEYEYDELGHETRFKSFLNDSIKFMRSSSYLDNGLIIESKDVDFSNRTTKLNTYKYEFY